MHFGSHQWGLLQGWLAEDTGLLSVMDGVKRASRDWAANGKTAAWVTHSTDRLRAAERLRKRDDLSKFFDNVDWDYVKACRRRVRRGQVWSGIVAACAVGVGWLAYDGLLTREYLAENIYRPVSLLPIFWSVTPTPLTASADTSPTAGHHFRECRNCPEMVVVQAGSFMMGSRDGEGGTEERPQHKVMIARPLAVAKFEVTFDEWYACVSHGGCKQDPGDRNWGRGRRPVINVSWNDAKEYVEWLAKQTGRSYRLLTEAEWEYAARAGTTTLYSWGDEAGEGNANCNGCKSQWDNKQTAPVGSFKPNAFGLHDMHGNVLEWVEDAYRDSYKDAPSDGSAVMAGSSSSRVLRGGSWNSHPADLRSADRYGGGPAVRDGVFGFRVARTLLAP